MLVSRLSTANVAAHQEAHDLVLLPWRCSDLVEEELEEEEEVEDALEDFHNNTLNAFANGESKAGPSLDWGQWNPTQLGVFFALPLVAVVAFAAYRCKARSGRPRRSTRGK